MIPIDSIDDKFVANFSAFQSNRIIYIYTHTHASGWFSPLSNITVRKLWSGAEYVEQTDPFPIHPKLRNINLHNITHSLISQNLKDQMFVIQISLLIVTFLSLVSWFCHYCKPTKKSTHTLALCRVSICAVSSSSSSYATCWLLVHAYVTSPGKAKWSGPYQQRWEENELIQIS